jgi:hypothetical protein
MLETLVISSDLLFLLTQKLTFLPLQFQARGEATKAREPCLPSLQVPPPCLETLAFPKCPWLLTFQKLTFSPHAIAGLGRSDYIGKLARPLEVLSHIRRSLLFSSATRYSSLEKLTFSIHANSGLGQSDYSPGSSHPLSKSPPISQDLLTPRVAYPPNSRRTNCRSTTRRVLSGCALRGSLQLK